MLVSDDDKTKLLHIIEKIMIRKNIALVAFDEILICFHFFTIPR